MISDIAWFLQTLFWSNKKTAPRRAAELGKISD
jgi:hypothetical protein